MVAVGQRFRLKQHIGYHPEDPKEDFQDRHAPLFADQVGEVVAIIPDGETGAGVGADHVILAFEHHALGDHRDHAASAAQGRRVGLVDPPHTSTGITRYWSCTEQQLADWAEEVTS